MEQGGQIKALLEEEYVHLYKIQFKEKQSADAVKTGVLFSHVDLTRNAIATRG